MKEVIIYQPWGGLGDNLAHSMIPEICHNNNIPCYLSNQNVCRNEEIHNLIWKKNPYIKGTKDSKNMDWLQADPLIGKYFPLNSHNHVCSIQCKYGFIPTHHYPILYYQPKYLKEVANMTIIDVNCYSFYAYPAFKNQINMLNYNNGLLNIIHDIDPKTIFKVATKANYVISLPIPAINNILQTYQINNLEHYCDVMFSCKNFICCNSGQMVLCCTIKDNFKSNTNIFVFTLEQFMPPKNYDCLVFDNADYIAIDTMRILKKK